MISLTHPPLNRTSYGSEKRRMPTEIQAQAGCSKLEKFKKLWVRRVKPIISTGSQSTSVSKAHRRRTVMTDMIGFPHGFTHSNHLGVLEMPQADSHPRKPTDVPILSLFGSADWTSLLQLPESEVEFMSPRDQENCTMASLTAKYHARHSTGSSFIPALPNAKKVKRKSVPIDILQETMDPCPRKNDTPAPKPGTSDNRLSYLSIEESLIQLINRE